MKRLLTTKLLLLLTISVYGQTNLKTEPFNSPQCISIETESEKEVRSKLYYGNNDALIDILRQHQFDVPDDYFSSLDGLGRYKGESLSAGDFSLDLSKQYYDDNSDVLDEQTVISAMAMSSGTTYYIPLKIWIYKNTSGQRAMTDNEIYAQVRHAQRVFSSAGTRIVFYVKCSMTEITNNTYYNLTNQTDMFSMFNANQDANAINVHIVRTGYTLGAGERPGKRLFIARSQGSFTFTSTLAHELGHNFGLRHTFHGEGCLDGLNGNCADCNQEPVDRLMNQPGNCSGSGLKCAILGDLLCDTPADPGVGVSQVNGSCVLTESLGNDNWGQQWNPSTTNIMAYTNDNCFRHFTIGQVGIMLTEINTSLFNFKSTTTTRSISGPSLVCPGQGYTYSTTLQTSGSPYQWVVPDGWTVNSQGNSTVTITANGPGNSSGWVNVVPDCGLGVLPLRVTIDNNQLDISGPSPVVNDPYPRTYSYFTEFYSGASYTWSVPSGWSILNGQGSFSVGVQAPANPNPGTISVTATNVCGASAFGSRYISVSGSGGPPLLVVGGGPATFGPNPVVDVIKLIDVVGNQSLSEIVITELSTGKPILEKDLLKINDTIDMSGLKSGYYELSYVINKEHYTETIIKQ